MAHNTDISMMKLNADAQIAFDRHYGEKLEEQTSETDKIYARSQMITGLISDLENSLKGRGDNDTVALPTEIIQQIEIYRNQVWTSLQETKQDSESSIIDFHNQPPAMSQHPFPPELDLSKLKGKDLHQMCDKLTIQLDRDRNALNRLISQSKRDYDTYHILSEMSSYRAKQDDIKTFVRNQIPH